MLNNQSLSPGLQFTFYLLISSFILLSACEQQNAESKHTKSLVTQSQTQPLASLLPVQEAQSMIDLFRNDSINIYKSFLYEVQGNEEKVLSFRMNKTQRDTFFQKLEQLVADSTVIDSFRIRISMGLWNPQPVEDEDSTTNFVPLLQFLVSKDNKDSLVYPAYPLLAFESKVDWTSFECSPDSTQLSTEPSILVSCPNAIKMLDRWLNLPTDSASITKQLYINDPSLTLPVMYELRYRIKYYTFSREDTKNIYNHYHKLDSLGEPCYFHLHFGLLDRPDRVPLRNILHLDDRDISRDSILSATNATYFEFSRPCPKYCGSGTSSQ